MIINFHNYAKPYGRRIHRNGQTWTYRIKSNADVQIRVPKGNVTLDTNAFEMNGMTWEEWQGKREPGAEFTSIDIAYAPSVPPSLVREWIDKYASDMLQMSKQKPTLQRKKKVRSRHRLIPA